MRGESYRAGEAAKGIDPGGIGPGGTGPVGRAGATFGGATLGVAVLTGPAWGGMIPAAAGFMARPVGRGVMEPVVATSGIGTAGLSMP